MVDQQPAEDPVGPTITDNEPARRFELHHDGELISFASYQRRHDATVLTHVETLLRHRDQGNADVLMAGVLDRLRAEGRTVVPVCSFAAAYLRDHPDQHDLLA